MPFYEIYGCDEAFEKFYEVHPNLFKRHEKYFNEECDDTYLAFANRYHPADFNDWVSSLGKLYEYEKQLYVRVDRHNNLIIISYYSINFVRMYFDYETKTYRNSRDNGLYMRFIYDTETTSMHHYRMKNFRNITYVLNSCDGRYQMGGWTDFDKFYTQYQRSLDTNSIAILKSLERFKYLPIELFKKISVYNLFQVNNDTIYQYEILLKNKLYNMASDLLLSRSFIGKDDFKRFKNEIMSGIRAETLNELIYEYKQAERERIEKLKKSEQIKKFAKMPKLQFDLGDYIIRHPKNFNELEHEGHVLGHCVASYLERIVVGKTDVFFLRKKEEPDKPFFTVEVAHGSVIQVRTLKNQTDPEITELVENWNKQRLSTIAA